MSKNHFGFITDKNILHILSISMVAAQIKNTVNDKTHYGSGDLSTTV